MSLAASRAVLRQSRFALRRPAARHASNTSEAAKEKAAQATSKASEGLARASATGSAAFAKASQFGGAALQRLASAGGRTAKVAGFVQSLIPPTVYYSRVTLELGKIVFQARKMSPPSTQTFQAYFQPLINTLKNPSQISGQTSNLLARVRNANRAELASAGVVAAEVLGFFTVGEMIGRMKIVGYRSSAPAHH
ncbi:atp synthase subunit g [Diplodia corticola]|uniref:Atp synthase subunit g n=1 Tax=Diplodia corticola TaxID=236234 RepID=A0A1J9S4D5_9PEZI|nr:atp synthase subunit g [Diplodia corticola]OJD35399.1 atp synthase subunit g [Diplodia corticola]